MRFLISCLATIFLGGMILSGCTEDPCGETLPLELFDSSTESMKTFCAYEAITEEERKAGLLAYPPLETDEALLIVFPLVGEVCITTEEMTYPIDVLFLDADGVVIEVGCERGETDSTLCVDGVKEVLEVLPQPDCEQSKGWSTLK